MIPYPKLLNYALARVGWSTLPICKGISISRDGGPPKSITSGFVKASFLHLEVSPEVGRPEDQPFPTYIGRQTYLEERGAQVILKQILAFASLLPDCLYLP